VASSLLSELSPAEISSLNRRYTENPEAYELYLKGVFELRTYTRTGVNRAHEYFKHAIAIDSSFAMAYNWLGHSYIAKASIFGAEMNALEALDMAIIPIEKSLEIDPGLSEARAIRAFYFLYREWDFQKAEEEYKLGINDREPEGYALYADYLNFVRRHKEALIMCQQQELHEPYYPNPRMILSLYYNGRIEEALSYAEDRLRIMKNYWNLDSYGFVLLNSGDYDRAIEIFQQIFQIENLRYPRILGWLGAAYARAGQHEKAEAIVKELKDRQAESSAGSTAFFTAVVCAAQGNSDEALRWLRVAIDDHEMEIPWLISEPQFYDLHMLPKFREMVKEIGFPSF
jgi:tetratricopeptide (TPR) repeat protein